LAGDSRPKRVPASILSFASLKTVGIELSKFYPVLGVGVKPNEPNAF